MAHTFQDFLSLGVGTLRDYLSVRGIPSSGYKKLELVARAFSAAEMGLPIIMSSEEQSRKLNSEYEERLQEFNLEDPLKVPTEMRIDDVKVWPKINLGNIFAYILTTRDFDTEYIGKYKDQKAYAYFDSGFVGNVLVHRPDPKKKMQLFYCNVRQSMKVSDEHELWIAIEDNGKVLTTWCSCTAGSSRCCNHVIATLYKLEYANTHGYNDVACTSVPCQWNKSTKKDIMPRRIRDMVVRKRVRTSLKTTEKQDETAHEEKRLVELKKFDPRQVVHRKKTNEHVSNLYQELQKTCPNAVVFKSIDGFGIPYSHLQGIIDIAQDVIANSKGLTNDEKITTFLKQIVITKNEQRHIEKATRGQADSTVWIETRKGRITASTHHDVFTKVNTIAKQRKLPRPVTTRLVAQIINKDDNLSHLPAIKWGRQHESEALKQFYAMEVGKHEDFKMESCGLYLDCTRPYIGASPDAIMYCKCHFKSSIEVKCPYSIKDKTILEGQSQCEFLKMVNNKVMMNKSHKYYTQITSQIMLSESSQGYFVVWTEKDIFIELVEKDDTHWGKVHLNLEIFFHQYVVKALLNINPLTYCASCDKVLLEEDEIAKHDSKEQKICCYNCNCWYHSACQNISMITDGLEQNWLCFDCISCITE